jgi:hypothetical protein
MNFSTRQERQGSQEEGAADGLRGVSYFLHGYYTCVMIQYRLDDGAPLLGHEREGSPFFGKS